MEWRCSKCKKRLLGYGDQVMPTFGQLEGLVCPGCGITTCDSCKPTSMGIKCPHCKTEMVPNFPLNLKKYYKATDDTDLGILGYTLVLAFNLALCYLSYSKWNSFTGPAPLIWPITTVLLAIPAGYLLFNIISLIFVKLKKYFF